MAEAGLELSLPLLLQPCSAGVAVADCHTQHSLYFLVICLVLDAGSDFHALKHFYLLNFCLPVLWSDLLILKYTFKRCNIAFIINI